MSEVREVTVDGRSVRVSNPSKIYFPELGLTKGDVIDYFLAVGPGILGALRDRPTTMERWPDGVREETRLATRAEPGGQAWFQKRAPKGTPEWVQLADVTFPSGRAATQVAPGDVATVVWMVNLGTLRFHPWPVHTPDVEHVDQLRIDLDPQPGTTFGDAVTAAIELRAICTELGLTPFVKTSGGRGVHVFAPVQPVSFVDARHAVIAIGRELARRMPALVTVNWWKEERGERIFVDFNQMARDRLMTSAYSIRPTPAGQVSAPLEWDELVDAHPSDLTLVTVPARFATRGDAWADLALVAPSSLAQALEWFERDARAGEGELPYPPEYPKMPGEPSRVQPSRAKKPSF
jgi:DNA ligase D-like protein (predicted polymerase)